MATKAETDRREQHNRYQLRNRYIFEGQFEMETALHIGGGTGIFSSSNSRVVLTPEQQPFIPGSSFKGALRSTVEKIVPSLPKDFGFSSCALIELSDEESAATFGQRDEWPDGLCPTIAQRGLSNLRRKLAGQAIEPEKIGHKVIRTKGEKVVHKAMLNLCDTCLLFGSPFAAARLSINDLYMSDWNGVIERRDGVAIDRDSEKAKDGLKYDFEVVPASARFDLKIVLENATQRDLALLCVGLSEFVHGFGAIGGKRSRGLGMGKLTGLRVSALELIGEGITPEMRSRRLRDYLVAGKPEPEPAEKFLREQIERLFVEPGR
jgi:CRISPR/Cas system CSM-associated protein Csm3 (group 7 of RAMP superfamily)